MDEGDQEKTRPELSDSWMVVNDSLTDPERETGGPSDGSDGESVEVIDQEEYEEVLTGETDCDAVPPEEEMIGPKNKKYVHRPNEDVNAALNRLMVIAASIVVGLAIGHYLGYSEEVNDMATAMKKMEAENIKLKDHICMIFESYNSRISGHDYPELKHVNENYAIFLTVVLNIKCPLLESKIAGLQSSLDDLRVSYMKGHLSNDALQHKIHDILKNHPVSLENTNHVASSNEAPQDGNENVIPAARKLTDIASQASDTDKLRKELSEIHLLTETSETEPGEGNTSAVESVVDSTSGSAAKDVKTQIEPTTKASESTMSEELLRVNLLTESIPPYKKVEGCQSPITIEAPTENTLKHIVKDIVQEMAESLLASHHNNIIKDIREEAKKLQQSVPVFKSALLLNMEVTSKLKTHLRYLKDTFHSFLDQSQLLPNEGKVYKILHSISHHTFNLEKAMKSLQLLEDTLNQNRGSPFKSQENNMCTVVDFFKEYFINMHHNIQISNSNLYVQTEKQMEKHNGNLHDESQMVYANQRASLNNVIKEASVENIQQENIVEKHIDEKISDSDNFQQQYDELNIINKLHNQQKSNKYDEKLPYNYKESKKKHESNTYKYKNLKLHSTENEHSNKKHGNNFQNSGKMKDHHHDLEKDLNRKNHYKQEKQFKRELHGSKKKNSHKVHLWEKDEYEHRHSNMSGDWVIDLNRARAAHRENEHKSDWLFERANARKDRRNGKWDMNNWYFQRAEGRKYCRKKSDAGKSSSSCPSPKDSEDEFHYKKYKKQSKNRKYFNPKSWISKAYMAVSKYRF